MPSVSQQTSRSKKAPPPALIDGVSQQQIADVVEAHVGKTRMKAGMSSAVALDLEKRLKATETRLDNALDQMKLAQDMFHQGELLFKAIYSTLKGCQTSNIAQARAFEDALSFADLGMRESGCWSSVMENEREQLGVRA